MLKPGSSKLKESEVKLLEEIKEFEKQEDKTLQNMEETLLMMSSLAPTASPPSTEANFQDVTLKQIIQEDNQNHFIDDSDAEVDSELFDTLRNEFSQKHGSKIINLTIQNMGKQTIIVRHGT